MLQGLVAADGAPEAVTGTRAAPLFIAMLAEVMGLLEVTGLAVGIEVPDAWAFFSTNYKSHMVQKV